MGAVEWSRYVDGVSNLAHKVVDLTDTKALALLVEMEERVFCVTRSRTPELDASRLAGTLGGGGHPEAASAIFRGRLGPAKERLLAGLQSAVRELPTAAEIMSSPPRTVCRRHGASALVTASAGQSGILVATDDRPKGRRPRDLDRAVSHGLSCR